MALRMLSKKLKQLEKRVPPPTEPLVIQIYAVEADGTRSATPAFTIQVPPA